MAGSGFAAAFDFLVQAAAQALDLGAGLELDEDQHDQQHRRGEEDDVEEHGSGRGERKNVPSI